MRNPRNLVGPEVRRLRVARNFSQPQLAALLQRKGWDATRDTVARIEGQVRWVADFEMVFLAKVLGVPLQELLSRRKLDETVLEFLARLERSGGE